jgi:hypothetical protein
LLFFPQLSHIRSDQLEKANLASALTEARAEVAALREEVRLLRIGVQKLGADRPHQSADARLERRCHQISPARVELEKPLSVVPPARPQQTSARQRRISLEALLNEITLPNPITDKDEQLSVKHPFLLGVMFNMLTVSGRMCGLFFPPTTRCCSLGIYPLLSIALVLSLHRI